MRRSLGVLALVAGLTATSLASAGIITPPAAVLDSHENEAFLGLNWNLGGTMVPEVELGYRKVTVDGSGDVQGGAVSFSFVPGAGFDKVKLKGIKGKENAQGELGVGYSFLKGAPLGTVGVQGPHLNLGVDLMPGNAPQLHGGINTIGGEDKSTRCPSGYTYDASAGNCTSGGA